MAVVQSQSNVQDQSPSGCAALTQGHVAVVGMQWGDEGKGQIVDLMANKLDVVVRYNGGANAGHSVHVGDEKFALHLLPSGILQSEKLNVVGNGVVVDPMQIVKEIQELRSRDVPVGPNLRISDRAHVVLPYHKVQDALFDHAVARTFDGASAIGTTGRGIGPCYADKALRSTAVRMGDLLDRDRLLTKLKRIVAIKNVELGALAQTCGDAFEPFDAQQVLAELEPMIDVLEPMIVDTTVLLHEAMTQGKRILFEGANAALLDVDHGTYPYVTSSSCSSLGIYPGTGTPGGTLDHAIGIAKLYTSRVGEGPFPTELHDATGDALRDRGQEYGTTTGRPRRCGWLDLVAVRYTAQLSGITALACTGLSVLSGLDQIKVCVGYCVDGKTLSSMPADLSVLERVEPVYETLPGIGQPVDQCQRAADLPAAANALLEKVEQFTGVPVQMVCVGRRRDQILVRN